MSWNIRYKFSSAFLMNRLYKIELIDGRSLGFFLSNAATMFRRSYEYLFDMGGYDPLKIFSINVFMHPMKNLMDKMSIALQLLDRYKIITQRNNENQNDIYAPDSKACFKVDISYNTHPSAHKSDLLL